MQHPSETTQPRSPETKAVRRSSNKLRRGEAGTGGGQRQVKGTVTRRHRAARKGYKFANREAISLV